MNLKLFLQNDATGESTLVAEANLPEDSDLLAIRWKIDDWLDGTRLRFGGRPTEGCRWVLAVDATVALGPRTEFKWGQGKGTAK